VVEHGQRGRLAAIVNLAAAESRDFVVQVGDVVSFH
jgi:hypothetical protein